MAGKRLTFKQVSSICDNVNRTFGLPEATYIRKNDGAFVAQIGNIYIDQVFNYYNVVQVVTDGGGIETLAGGLTLSEARLFLTGMICGYRKRETSIVCS